MASWHPFRRATWRPGEQLLEADHEVHVASEVGVVDGVTLERKGAQHRPLGRYITLHVGATGSGHLGDGVCSSRPTPQACFAQPPITLACIEAVASSRAAIPRCRLAGRPGLWAMLQRTVPVEGDPAAGALNDQPQRE